MSVSLDRPALRAPDSVAGAVRAACDVRLACLALAVLIEATSRPVRPLVVLALLMALPLSYIPLRAWDRLGDRLGRSHVLATADLVVMVSLVLCQQLTGPMLVYAGATVLLLVMVLGPRWGPFGLVAVVVAEGVGLAAGVSRDPVAAGITVGLTAVVGYAGLQLRSLLLERSALRASLDAAQLESAHAAERARLAREMHDSLSKTLHGVHLLAESLERRLQREGHAAADRADEIARAAELARRDARSLIADLRELPSGDLREFVEQTAHRARESGLEVSLRVHECPPLGVAATYEVAKSLAELTDNVVRHAGADRLDVEVRAVNGWLEIELRDDGRGMPEPDLGALQRAGHFGLVGVHERMARAGGVVRLRPGPRGTTALLRAPLGAGDETAPAAAEEAR